MFFLNKSWEVEKNGPPLGREGGLSLSNLSNSSCQDPWDFSEGNPMSKMERYWKEVSLPNGLKGDLGFNVV